MILKQDDFEVGQFITVLNNKRTVYQTIKNDIDGTIATAREDKSWIGTIFCIKAMCLPFIVVNYCGSYYKDVFKTIIDTREFDFVKLPDKFVKKYVDNIKKLKLDIKEGVKK